MEIAVIGAGMAGLTAARTLAKGGHAVRLFDKGRGPGGRMSTRRAQTPRGEVRFDHGAQHFSPRQKTFAAEVTQWVEAGAAARWEGSFVTINEKGDVHPAPDRAIFVGTPSMNAIVRHLCRDLDVTWGRRVETILGDAGSYALAFEGGAEEAGFDAVVVAVPLEQVSPLLAAPAPDLAARTERLASDPCWTIMVAFDEPLEAPFDAASFETGPLAWTARNSSKPGRGSDETWVLQASADWSRTHLEDDATTVEEALLDAFAPPLDPIFIQAHRWRFSQVVAPLGEDALWDATIGIGACGDWLCGRGIEDAWSSGLAVAHLIMDKAS
ncbi:MAG: FAD-dependent oxidoreductase [Pseudomonadota bacterium]